MSKRFRRRRRARPRLQKLRAGLRDTFLLLGEFTRPLLLFILAIGGGGELYYLIASSVNEPIGGSSLAEATYHVLGLTFLQPLGDNLPIDPRLQIFYFVMPIIGLSILAQGLADFGQLFFNRRARSKEWEMAVASMFNNHVVLVGLGHLGFRVTRSLHHMELDTVAIEMDPHDELIEAVQEMGIPVIQDDASHISVLKAAGIERAQAIILCTQNDSLNLQIAFKARKHNPAIRPVLRIFDDDFAQMVREEFGFAAMSATEMAAPTFATAATSVDITPPITVEGESFSLARFDVQRGSQLIGLTVSQIEQEFDVSVVLLRQNGESDFHPPGEIRLGAGDVLAVLGGVGQLGGLLELN